ncbi:Ovarian tumor, otubain [Artemisia annua]|uniref:Ovarian tumor, otubain n=1 Tax=Artemisia annua TaxID=35608 RepID=A0A2U1NNZ6_ARTAN|nr:Ovarian tumor, otubain [Artemisia annua]
MLMVHDHELKGSCTGKYSLRPAGEGSWNVAWDVRPARWLHRPQTAWLLFGICAAAPVVEAEVQDEDNGGTGGDDKTIIKSIESCVTVVSDSSSNYKITENRDNVFEFCLVEIDLQLFGNLLKLALYYEEAPDENRQRELADELRAQVVDELLKRRKEIEWFIEGDFDVYVKRIEKPYVWGGEPELLMASHILK